MKTKIMFTTLMLSLAVSSLTYAQDNSGKFMVPMVGVGLHIEQFRLGDILNDNLPTNSFILSINVNNSFRIEPEFGFYSRTDEGTAGEPDLTASSTKLALGLYYMFQKESFNFSVGALVQNNSLSEEGYNFSSSGYTTYTNETKVFGFGPSLCGEYFFGKHFSFGGNLALLFSSLKATTSTGSDESKSNSSQTVTGLQARFYF